MRYFFPLLIILITASCTTPAKKGQQKRQETIIIQPFNGTPKEQVDYVYNQLIKVYPSVHLNTEILYPKEAWYAPRNRYRADSLIRYLSRSSKAGYITIGLTNKDISVSKDKQKDWGIMGLGYCPGKACIASTYRLSKSSLNDQFFKVAIHELGHNEGLPHCSSPSCFMQDADGSNKTDQLHEFCSNCKNHLLQKGWTLN